MTRARRMAEDGNHSRRHMPATVRRRRIPPLAEPRQLIAHAPITLSATIFCFDSSRLLIVPTTFRTRKSSRRFQRARPSLPAS